MSIERPEHKVVLVRFKLYSSFTRASRNCTRASKVVPVRVKMAELTGEYFDGEIIVFKV